MSSPSSFAPPPTPISAVAADTLGLRFVADKYGAVTAVCIVAILYFLAFSYYKARNRTLSESGNAAAGALPAMPVREMVQIDASVSSYKKDENDNNDECAICLNEFKEGQECRTMEKCGHLFHRSCIDQWFKVEQPCPLCRSCIRIVIQP